MRRLAVVALVVAGLVVLRGQAPRPNLLLITLDTVRADHLGAYGDKAAATPALDRLAREGVRFTDASTQAPLTGPAHAAILTGVYPARFGIRDNASTPIPDTAVTLAQALKKAGYRTGGFVAAFILDRAYGFDHGFDEFDSHFERFEAGDKLKAERTADQVLRPALAWLSRVPANAPFFAWVHFYDAHAPYTPPEPYRSTFRTHPYDGEIAYVDAAVGKLRAKLEERGLLEKTMIVAIGDHGESLGEHGEAEHGEFLYDSVLHIPWIVRLPAHERAGSVIVEQVRAIDLMPTALGWLGVARPGGLDGQSLVSVLRGTARRDVPPSYAETFYGKFHHGWSELYSLRVPEWKFIDAPRPELYDLRTDKAELGSVIDRQSNVAGRLGTDLRQVIAGFGPGATTQAATPDRETLERLRSLGYVGFAGTGGGAGRGPDPKDMIGQLQRFRLLMTKASDSLRKRQPQVAIESLKQALAISERSYDVHLELGDVYAQEKQYEPALGEYDAAALLNPASPDPPLAAANVFLSQGRLDRATQKIDQAAALAPRSFEVPLMRGRVAEQQGLNDQALEQYQRAVDTNPSDARSKARLANTALQLRRYDLAGPLFATLIDMGYQPSRSHLGLALVAEGHGDRAKAVGEYRKALALEPTLAAAREALARLAK